MTTAAATTAPCLPAALDYLGLGWSVLCLCPPDHDGCPSGHARTCTSPGKRPVANLGLWEEYQHRLPSRDEVEAWWDEFPAANVGMACGSVSRVVGVDVDGEAGWRSLDRVSGGDLPETLAFRTGRGGRYLYAVPAGLYCVPTPFPDEDGSTPLSLLGDGNQTVLPPSRHASGRSYEWEPGHGPGEVGLADAPLWLVDVLESRARTANRRESVKLAPASLAPAQKIREHQGRQNYLFRAGCALRRVCPNDEDVETSLRTINLNRFDPPLDEAELRHTIRNVLKYKPALAPSDGQALAIMHSRPAALRKAERVLIRRDLSTVQPRPVPWLWQGLIPLGNLTCFDGEGGTGKSTAIYDVLARVTRGDAMPDGTAADFHGPADVVVVACEDDVAATVVPRLNAAGADLTAVEYLDYIGDAGGKRLIQVPEDLDLIGDAVKARRAKALLIDPVFAFYTGDTVKDAELRQKLLTPLKTLAEDLNVAVILVRHLNKAVGIAKAAFRSSGSYAFVGASRSTLLVGRHPDKPDESVLAWVKGNLAPPQPSLSFRMVETEHGACRVEWLGACDLTADDLVAPPGNGPRARGTREPADLTAALEWLNECLRPGGPFSGHAPVPALRDAADVAGIPWQSALQAKAALGVVGYPGGQAWYWKLASTPEPEV